MKIIKTFGEPKSAKPTSMLVAVTVDKVLSTVSLMMLWNTVNELACYAIYNTTS